MYKIYVNGTPLVLSKTEEDFKEFQGKDDVLVNAYSGGPKHLLQVIDMLEKTDRWALVILHAENPKRLWKDFKKIFKRIDAAGGIVMNPSQKILA
ncbi:MAG: hypothetical protein HKN16_02045, partial [Saprospiraceae bacterium]|nr:hypothetical protein [Saprospiraceae bacterium]